MSKPDKRRVHVAEIKKTYKGKVYVSTYLRRTFREDGKVKHETVANISRTCRTICSPSSGIGWSQDNRSSVMVAR